MASSAKPVTHPSILSAVSSTVQYFLEKEYVVISTNGLHFGDIIKGVATEYADKNNIPLDQLYEEYTLGESMKHLPIMALFIEGADQEREYWSLLKELSIPCIGWPGLGGLGLEVFDDTLAIVDQMDDEELIMCYHTLGHLIQPEWVEAVYPPDSGKKIYNFVQYHEQLRKQLQSIQ